jgi:hypothetical protein
MPAPTYRLGKAPFVHDSDDLLMSTYATPAVVLPTLPANFGHDDGFTDWGMLGNDQYGDCGPAGAAHQIMQNAHAGGRVIPSFTTTAVLANYSAITGFKPSDPSTDQGVEVRSMLAYWQKSGMVDANGKRHKIGAYVRLEPGNTDQLFMAIRLFDTVGVGYQLPQSAEEQFNNGKGWSVVKGSPIVGGHYVPGVARRTGHLRGVTWARDIAITLGFYRANCDEAWGILSEETLTAGGKTSEGFDWSQLLADRNAILGL